MIMLINPPKCGLNNVDKVVLNSNQSHVFALFQTGRVGCSRLSTRSYWGELEFKSVYTFSGDDDARIDDIVDFYGKILGVDRVGRLYGIPVSKCGSRENVISIAIDCGTTRKRLVESNGNLYLVVRVSMSVGEEIIDQVVRFKVYELDQQLGEWIEVSCVGGKCFFFGLDFSFSVSPEKLGGSFRGNCIVYKQGSFKDYDCGSDDDDADDGNDDDDNGNDDDDNMHSAKSRTCDLQIEVWHMDDPCHIGAIELYPGYSNVIWPPPLWFWNMDMSKRLGHLEAALDDLLKDGFAEKWKAISEEFSSPKQLTGTDDVANQPDASEIWSAPHILKICLVGARGIWQRITTKSVSGQHHCEGINLQSQVGSFSCGTEERQGPVDSIQGASEHSETVDAPLSREMLLHGLIFKLEETTSKVQEIYMQLSVDAVE